MYTAKLPPVHRSITKHRKSCCTNTSCNFTMYGFHKRSKTLNSRACRCASWSLPPSPFAATGIRLMAYTSPVPIRRAFHTSPKPPWPNFSTNSNSSSAAFFSSHLTEFWLRSSAISTSGGLEVLEMSEDAVRSVSADLSDTDLNSEGLCRSADVLDVEDTERRRSATGAGPSSVFDVEDTERRRRPPGETPGAGPSSLTYGGVTGNEGTAESPDLSDTSLDLLLLDLQKNGRLPRAISPSGARGDGFDRMSWLSFEWWDFPECHDWVLLDRARKAVATGTGTLIVLPPRGAMTAMSTALRDTAASPLHD
mmetsp:Transcript_10029/g.29768  ORF Transcript_10029/g.29768 Transcript_10029/m.29768 type:complete len:309 (+) Transcript_10029:545-1471(+)